MITKSIAKAFCIVLIISSIFSMPSLTFGGYTLKDNLIAGHSILKIYDSNNSGLSGKGVYGVFQDSEGLFWIATIYALHQYDEKRDQWVDFLGYGAESSSYNIEFMGQSVDKKIWVAGNQTGADDKPNVSSFDGRRWWNDFGPSRSNLKGFIQAMFPGKDGKLWFAISNKLAAYDGREWSFLKPVAKKVNGIQSGIQDSEGYIWLGTMQGVFRVDQYKQEWRVYSEVASRFVRSIYEDRKGRIWFADQDDRIAVYKKDTDAWTYYSLPAYMVRIPRPSEPDFKHTDKLAAIRLGIDAIHEDRAGKILFATPKGLFSFVEKENKWELFTQQNSNLPSDLITCITEDDSGRIWIGTGKGLIVLAP